MNSSEYNKNSKMAKEYYCSICNYKNERRINIKNHIIKKKACGDNPVMLVRNIDITCKHCNNSYSGKKSLNTHLKVCKVLRSNENDQLKQKVKELEEKLEKANAKPTSVTNNIININLNGYQDTDFSKLTDRHFGKALNRTLMSIPQLIEYTHFNSKAPENHNIYISNIQNKFDHKYF